VEGSITQSIKRDIWI